MPTPTRSTEDRTRMVRRLATVVEACRLLPATCIDVGLDREHDPLFTAAYDALRTLVDELIDASGVPVRDLQVVCHVRRELEDAASQSARSLGTVI